MNNSTNKINLNKILNGSIFRFAVIGVINTAHNMAWYKFFLDILKIQYQISFGLAFILAMIGSFFLNTYFTFKTKPTLNKFLKFPITTLPNFIISQFGLKVLAEYIHVDKFWSGLLASLISIPITYLVTKYVLTKGDDDKKDINLNDDKNLDNDGESLSNVENKSGKVIYNFGTLSKLDKWLTLKDLIFFILIIAFAFIDHNYIFRQGKLYGVKSTDSTVQMIYFLPFLIKDFMLEGNLWSWFYGMGGDIYSEFSYYYTTSPFIWTLVPAFKFIPSLAGYLTSSLAFSLKLKLFISIYKQALFMIFMYILLRYEKRSKLASFAASIVYGGGLYYLWTANYFDFMTDAYIWVPLMVLGFRIFQKKRNFWPLVISAGLCAINNYYFAFHTFMFFILFVLIMITPEGIKMKDKVSSYFNQLRTYGLIGLASLLLSQFAFLPAVFSFLKLDRFSNENPVNLFHDRAFYESIPINLFFNNSTIGVSMLFVLFLFISYGKTKDLTDKKILLMVIMLGLYCTPWTGYFLNGMNYHSERWFYLLIFAISYALADILDEMKRKNNFGLIFFLALCAGAAWLIRFQWEFVSGLDDKPVYITVLAANFIGFLLIALRKYIYPIRVRKIMDGLVVLSIAVALIGNSVALGHDQILDMDESTFKSEKMQSPELDDAMAYVKPKDGEFFRTVFRNNVYENVPTFYRFNGISTFASMTDGPMHDYIKRVLDIRHNIVYLSSFMNVDDRAYLEGMLGVKYIITDKDKYNPPPIYEKVHTNKKYDVFENKNTVGMDMWFENTFPAHQIESLRVPDRDLQLLNFAVTDEPIEGIEDAKNAILSEDIPLTEDVMTPDNVEIYEDSINFRENGRVNFKIPSPSDNSQLYLHSYLRPDDKLEFEQKVNDKICFKSYEDNPYVYYTNYWTFCLNGNEKEIGWTTAAKNYELKEFYLARVDLTNFNEVINKRNKYNMENLVIGKNMVSGKVSNKERGIMVFNIPYNKGWTLKVNGEDKEIQKMNGFLSGVVLEPGVNNLEFRFVPRGLKLGALISLLTLITLILIDLYLRKKKPFIINESKGEEITFNSKDLYTHDEEESGIRYFIHKREEKKKKDLLSKENINEEGPLKDSTNILPNHPIDDIRNRNALNDEAIELTLDKDYIIDHEYKYSFNKNKNNSSLLELSDEEKDKYLINVTRITDEEENE